MWKWVVTACLFANTFAFECQETSEATSSTTGSIITAGGIGIQKKVNVGGTLGVGGAATFTGDVTVTGTCTGCGGSGATIYRVSAQTADFSASLTTYGASKYSKLTNYRSAAITLTGATAGDVCSVSPHITGATNYAMIKGAAGGDCSLYCYVSAANTVYVVIEVGNVDISYDTDTEFDGDATLAQTFPVNIAVISVS